MMYFAELDYLMETNQDFQNQTSSMFLKKQLIPFNHNILCGLLIVTLRKEAGGFRKRHASLTMQTFLFERSGRLLVLVVSMRY